MKVRVQCLGGVIVWCMLLLGATHSAVAQTPLQDFFRDARYGEAVLSPNGKKFAYTTLVEGRLVLTVVDLATREGGVIAFGVEDQDVVSVTWINDKRLTYRLRKREFGASAGGSGLFAVNSDGSESNNLLWRSFTNTALLGPVLAPSDEAARVWAYQMVAWDFPDKPNELIALAYVGRRPGPIPYRVDTVTARGREISDDFPGEPYAIGYDTRQQIRFIETGNAENSVRTVWYRESAGSPWRNLGEQSVLARKYVIVGFDNDDKTVFAAAPTSAGRWAMHLFDPVKNELGKLIASDKWVDVDDGLVRAPDTKKVLGIRVPSDPPRTEWLDEGMAALQAGIDNALPGMVNVLHPAKGHQPVMIGSYSSTQPIQYYLYHRDQKKLQRLLVSKPWIDAKKMSPKRVYDYVARDGLPIPAYLTLPKGRSAVALPLVVLVHGGPHTRDAWGFDAEVQFLASLGYAVLQPQFRGSTGLGVEHLNKGQKQWGQAMQDDVTDGVLSLIKQGVVDPARVCIMGASYGGYAAMQGLVKDPDFYRCGINLMGVTNLFYITDAWGQRESNFYYKNWIGDRDTMKDQFKATSPELNAERIKAPVFMAYGEKDRVVPRAHGEDMRSAMRKHGKVFEYMELEGEYHSVAKEENRYKLYGAIEAFLRKHNPPH